MIYAQPIRAESKLEYPILSKDSRTVVVSQRKPLKPDGLKGIIEQKGLTPEQFVPEP